MDIGCIVPYKYCRAVQQSALRLKLILTERCTANTEILCQDVTVAINCLGLNDSKITDYKSRNAAHNFDNNLSGSRRC